MIISDLDGTLFTAPSRELSKSFITKVRQLTDCGKIFAVSSGRTYKDLKVLLKPIENRVVFICNDGAEIMYKNCLIYKNTIERAAFTVLAGELLNAACDVFAVTREKNQRVTNEYLLEKGNLGADVFKIVAAFSSTTAAEQKRRLKVLSQNLGLRVSFEDESYIEFVNKTADKGAAAKYLKEKFGVKSGVVAIGDGENDLPMFKEANKVYIVKGKANIYFEGAKQIANAQEFIIENL